MRDTLLKILSEKYESVSSPVIVEHHAPLREDKVYIPEAKKRFPHLTESFLVENKPLLENINFFKVTVKEIQQSFPGTSFAEARTMQKALSQFAIMEYYARTNLNEEEMADKIEESSKVILELEWDPTKTLDPNDPEVKKWAATNKAMKGKGPEDTVGSRLDFDSGKEAPAAPEKKKGFLKSAKDFLVKAGEYIKQVITSKKTWKALAIGAAMVILGVIAGVVGGWAAVGFAGLKAILGGISIFKGSKELIKTADFAQGKKGIEGVKQWIKSAKEPAAAAKVIIGVAQVALGAWGASSAIGQAMAQIKTMAAEQIKVAAPVSQPAAAPAQAAAPAPAASAPEVAPASPAPAAAPGVAAVPFKPTEFIQRMKTLVIDNAQAYLENPEAINAKILKKLADNGIDLDGPVSKAFPGAHGNMSVREYIEMGLESAAKAKALSGR